MDKETAYRPTIRIKVVYVDPPDLFELQTTIKSGIWSGCAKVYASPRDLLELCTQLFDWSQDPTGEARIEIGGIPHSGSLVLQFYTTDMAGHIACYATLVAPNYRKQSIGNASTLKVEIRTEPGLVDHFTQQLRALCQSLNGEAVLEGDPNPDHFK